MIHGLSILPKEDYYGILKGLELIRKTKMKDRDDLSMINAFGFDEYGYNLKIFCDNGSAFYLALSYIDEFYDEQNFNRTFDLSPHEYEDSYDLGD